MVGTINSFDSIISKLREIATKPNIPVTKHAVPDTLPHWFIDPTPASFLKSTFFCNSVENTANIFSLNSVGSRKTGEPFL